MALSERSDGGSQGRVLISAERECTGELQSVDGYMNIALEKTEEYVDGQKRRTYGDAFVRGNNGACSLLVYAICLRLEVRLMVRLR